MGDKLGVSENYVGQLENGRAPGPTLEKLFEVIEAKVREPDEEPASPQGAMRAARLRKGLSFADLAKLTGYRAGPLQRVEEGHTQASEQMIRRICDALQLDPELMMAGSDEVVVREGMQGTYGATPAIQPGPGLMRAKFVPLLSMATAGTMSQQAFTDGNYAHEGTLVFDPKDPNAFGVRLVGDSMEPKYSAGEIVIAYPSFPLRNDKPVICCLTEEAGGDVMFKIYQSRDNGRRVKLSSYNPAFEPVEFDRAQFRWIYPVAWVTKSIE